SNVKELEAASGLQEVEVMRALQWMSNKKIILTPVKQFSELVELDALGKRYHKDGLPEKRFLQAAVKNKKLDNIQAAGNLTDEEVRLCLGLLRKKAAIDIEKDKKSKGLVITLTKQGESLVKKVSFEEQFISTLAAGPKPVDGLEDVERYAFGELRKRKTIIKTRTEWSMEVHLTPLGKRLLKKHSLQGPSAKDIIDTLTPKMLKSGSWKNRKFRRYDVSINVPAVYPGKRHFVNQAIEYARRIWLDLGFKEMVGPLLQPAFWNFDALFTAQDHPVREMQDTFYIRKPGRARLPAKQLVEKVRKVHETGGKTGSTGWRYQWTPAEAKRNVLRTHTTVLSARTLAALKKEELPAKYFALGINFRNEAIDWSHNIEFNQTEGIVIDEDANFRHLLGYLKKFFRKMGYPDARF
ncbi:MAG: phenylalanine--tRNA ligase subunit alpha, partial [Candidatus Aenigmarchaeota archaeon]|nr:phenylalanine--tRNA ligase subunit alpha [Candidatus Aenigmarchaeota archaeon]